MLNRRAFLCGAISATLALPVVAEGQQAERIYRVALVFTTAPTSEMVGPDPVHPMPRAFLSALRALGYVEGRNLTYIPRSAEGKVERLRDILRDVVRHEVDVIVGPGDNIPRLVKEVTRTVPFVMLSFSDPVELGLVASLARPGGNFTGLTRTTSPDIEAKRLELLKETLPEISRVSYLSTKGDWERAFGLSARSAAHALGISLSLAEHSFSDYTDAFERITLERPDAVLVGQNTANFAQRRRIVDFATKGHLPSMHHFREAAEAGGLMSYGPDLADLYRRAAGYVDRILKGAKPGELPVERPRKFELVINLKTARALGLAIPPSLLLRADRVIE